MSYVVVLRNYIEWDIVPEESKAAEETRSTEEEETARELQLADKESGMVNEASERIVETRDVNSWEVGTTTKRKPSKIGKGNFPFLWCVREMH